MQHFLFMIAGVALAGCASTQKAKLIPNSPKAKAALERAISRAGALREGLSVEAQNPSFLRRVQKLWHYDTPLTDISPLAKYTYLKDLRLSYNNLTDISALSELKQLEKLQLNNNRLANIRPLAGLTQLKKLYLHNNQLSDINALRRLSQLKELRLSGNQLTDEKLKHLSGLKQMTHLNLGSNQLADVSAA